MLTGDETQELFRRLAPVITQFAKDYGKDEDTVRYIVAKTWTDNEWDWKWESQ